MFAFLTAARDNFLLYKLVILRAALFSSNTLILAFLAAVLHIDFPSLSAWQKFLIILAVFGNWGNTMLAFLDKTISTLATNNKP